MIMNNPNKNDKSLVKQILSKSDTNIFIKKSNKIIHFLYKMMIISIIKNQKENYYRYKTRLSSAKKNKTINNYPLNFLKAKKKIVVYTALYGKYDTIKKIGTKNPYCDYYFFTDQHIPNDYGWIKSDFNFPETINNDNILKNRYLKMHPHLLFPDYKYSIYIDASIAIDLDIYRLMSRMGNNILGLFDHHQKADCLYEEAKTIIRIKKAPKLIVEKQMNKYESEGFPHHFGFCECAVIIREHNNKKCIDIMNTWWNEFINGAKRDQLSFMYSIWKNGLTKKDIAYLGATYWDDPIIPSKGHLK